MFDDGTSDVKLENGSLRYPNSVPDQTKLVAVSGKSIVLVVPSVGIVKTLASDPAGVTWPKWSPDGTKILYSGGGTLSGSRRRRLQREIFRAFRPICD